MAKDLQVVIVTGLSGSGKTLAIQSLEDIGYYCIDNLPPKMIPHFIEMTAEVDSINQIALGVDLRAREFFNDLKTMLDQLSETSFSDQKVDVSILFLEADDSTLVRRYKETRRVHPLSQDTESTTLQGIQREREALGKIREIATDIIDTSDLRPKQLRQKVYALYNTEGVVTFKVQLISFGFKHGLPLDADLVMDVRFLPNPYYKEDLRPLTGLDSEVYDYVMKQDLTETFFEKFADLVDFLLPGYEQEGKNNINIAIGCTGGQHRSVALVERMADHIQDQGYVVQVAHRDIKKSQH